MAALTKRGGYKPGGGRPKSPEDKVVIGASLSLEVVDKAKEYAKSRRFSVSWVIEEALRKFLGMNE
jgi:hypothetical protein